MISGPAEGRLAGLARRIGCTEGQIESMAIGLLVLTVLTTFALPGVDWVELRDGASVDERRLAPAVSDSDPPTLAPPAGVGSGSGAWPGFRPTGPLDSSVEQPSPDGRTTSTTSPAAAPCDGQAAFDAGKSAVAALDELTGVHLPVDSLIKLLGSAAGCDAGNPLIEAVAVLVEIGRALPDPGLPKADLLPPFPPLPDDLVALLLPLAPVTGAACGVVHTALTIVPLVLPSYPYPVSGEDVASLFLEAAITCGRLTAAA